MNKTDITQLAPGDVLPLGIHAGIPDVVYHADTTSLSSSGAKTLAKPGGPVLFAWQQQHPREDTPAFRFGRAAHAAILEDRQVPVMPAPGEEFTLPSTGKPVKMTKGAATKAATSWVTEIGGHTWLTPDEADKLDAMKAAIDAHPTASGLLAAPGQAETSVIATIDDARVKARPDYWLDELDEEGRPVLIDYKTTIDADAYEFSRTVHKYGYHQSAAWYRSVLDAADAGDGARMIFIVQEKTAPYRVACYEIDPVAIDIGAELNAEALAAFKLGVAFEVWPGLPDDLQTVGLPAWAARAHQERSF